MTMGGLSLGFAVEFLVAVLLAVTIGYCVLVNRKLENLRSDQSDLRTIIRELNQATAQAENAIAGLSQNAATAQDTLNEQVGRVRELDAQLTTSIDKGEALLSKLTALSRASRTAAAPGAEEPRREIRPIRHNSIGLGLANARQRADTEAAAPGPDADGMAA